MRSTSPGLRRVEFRPEPTNPVDPQAVAVWMRGTRIGYAPRKLAPGLRKILSRVRSAELVDADEIEISLND